MIELISKRFVFPSLQCWLIVFPVSIIIGIAFGWLSGWLKNKYKMKTGYSRKVFHFLIFTTAGIIGITGGFEAVQVFGTAIGIVVGYAVLRGYKSRLFNAVARPGDKPYERFYVIIPFLMTALGGIVSNIAFGKYAVIGYITTGWGDAVGEPAGTRWGRHKYRIPTFTGIRAYRSVEGSIAVFLASLAGCIIVSLTGFHLPVLTVIYTSLITAFITMIVEAFTFHSIDNLTIQIFSTAVFVISLNWILRLSGS
jgi:phytol kinase